MASISYQQQGFEGLELKCDASESNITYYNQNFLFFYNKDIVLTAEEREQYPSSATRVTMELCCPRAHETQIRIVRIFIHHRPGTKTVTGTMCIPFRRNLLVTTYRYAPSKRERCNISKSCTKRCR